MNVFKIILGIIIIALGLGMVVAGWTIAVYGQWTPVVNIFFVFTLTFLGVGLGCVGVMLVRGSTIQNALGGIITAQPGLGGSSHYSSDPGQSARTYTGRPSRIKDLLSRIFLYTVIAICVILIAIFSVFRVTGGFSAWLE
jgi:hypothetical protein